MPLQRFLTNASMRETVRNIDIDQSTFLEMKLEHHRRQQTTGLSAFTGAA
jgi:hypothetical protein